MADSVKGDAGNRQGKGRGERERARNVVRDEGVAGLGLEWIGKGKGKGCGMVRLAKERERCGA